MPATHITGNETDLLRRFHTTRDPALRAELAERLLPLAHSIARRYAQRGEPLDDLIQVASIGLLKALDRFDPDRGVPFSGFAAPTITGEIRRHFRDTGWMVRPPRDLQELVLAVNATTERLSVDLGREPTTHEIAEATKTSVEDVAEALQAGTGYRADSLTLIAVKRILTQYRPNLVLINFMEPDGFAHAGNWPNYIRGIARDDRYVMQLYEFLQKSKAYRNNTALFVTNDHGRHLDTVPPGWTEHGDGCEGCRHISLLALGPDFRKGRTVKDTGTLVDVPSTVAYMLGIPFAQGQGKSIDALFKH